MRAVVRVLPLLLLLACTASREAVEPAESAGSSEEAPPPKTTVEVRNLQKVDVNLYVLRGANRVRLGTVPGMSTRSFVIPPHLVGKFDFIRFSTETIGSNGSSTSDQEMAVRPGDELSLTISQ
ncbi:MAG TPA: hypothetical protein VE153_01680 [Myxococcus sp.]|nr:hypothetical protein [Myxococcus sp.]